MSNRIDHSAKFANWGPVRTALAAEVRSLRSNAAKFRNDPGADYPYAEVIEHVLELGRGVFLRDAAAPSWHIVSTNHLAVGTYAVELNGSQVYGPATFNQCQTFADGLVAGLGNA